MTDNLTGSKATRAALEEEERFRETWAAWVETLKVPEETRSVAMITQLYMDARQAHMRVGMLSALLEEHHRVLNVTGDDCTVCASLRST